MSTSPNKENYPETPTKKERNGELSPSYMRSLKPISPNKTSNHTIGRLKFLDNDNIDEHFSYIHNSNEHIQQQLYDLQVQTKQTGVDLGQLFERLKNNNQFLNTLLENLSNYSHEVITEGNATKNDITKIIDHLNASNERIKELSSNQYLDKITEKIIDKLKISSIIEERDNIEERDSIPKGNFSEIILSDVKNVMIEDKLRNIIAPLIDEIKSNTASLKPAISEKETMGASFQEFERTTLDNLNKIIHEISNNKGQTNQYIETQSDTARKTIEITSKIYNESHQIKESIAKNNNQIHELQAMMGNNLIRADEVKNLLSLNQTAEELESKISNLENKYKLLSRKYEEKYQDLMSLQGEFQSLLDKTKMHQNALDSITQMPNITKVRQLHSANMQSIRNNSLNESKGYGKRIVSAPLNLGLVEEESTLNNTNNSDEGF